MNADLLRRIRQLDPAPPDDEIPERVWDANAVLEELERLQEHERRTRYLAAVRERVRLQYTHRPWLVAAAAAAIVVVLVGGLGLLATKPGGETPSPVAVSDEEPALPAITLDKESMPVAVVESDPPPQVVACDQRAPFGDQHADGSGVWVRGCVAGSEREARWVLEYQDRKHLVTPAVARSDAPIYGVLPDGTILILGLDISISDDLEVTIGSPTLWEYVGNDQWLGHPVDVAFPDQAHVLADVLLDPGAYPDDPIDQIIRDYGGIFLENYEITRVEGRLSVTGVDRTASIEGTTVPPGMPGGRSIAWLEDETGTLRPVESGAASYDSQHPGSADLGPPIDASGAVANFSTTTPDVAGAVLGDDGVGPLPSGVVNELPGEDYLNFLFEFCQPECYRDAHFMDPNNPQVGSGPWTAGRPFHVRHGFVNNGPEPLGEGFDVVMYITRWDGPDNGTFALGQTYKFTSDYVLRGTSDQCGPTYKTQTGPEPCEWFVHDFPEGIPEGRYDLWTVWEAPCSAWVGLGFTESCADPNEVISLFSAGVNSPFGEFLPSFTEVNEAQLSPEEIAELHEQLGEPFFEHAVGQPDPDPSGASSTGGTPLPDFDGAIPGDDGAGPLPLGVVNELPGEDYLNFLFEFCGWYQPECFRDAHFMDPNNPQVGSGPWTAGRPFHVRHGFINNGEEPLGEGFDVVLYVTQMDGLPSESGGVEVGDTVRYTSDYVLRGTSDQCGPTYRTQTGPETCEWFVHDFPDGLPEGRFAIWAVWEAPCWAWVDLGFTDTCQDPNEVISLFSSGVDSPFGPFPPSFTEANEA